MRWEADCLPPSSPCHVAGIGPERAALAAQRALEAGADALISFGSAGGIDPRAQSGSLWLTADIVDQPAPTEISRTFREQIAQQLVALEPACGRIVQCESVLHTVAQKQKLFELSSAQAVDMESAAIAQVARANNCPFVALRVVLDEATVAMPAELVDACDEYGVVRPLTMARTLLTRPHVWPSLMPLARSQAKVRKTLLAAGCMLIRR